jgi:flagellar basal body-associated protein FliL
MEKGSPDSQALIWTVVIVAVLVIVGGIVLYFFA